MKVGDLIKERDYPDLGLIVEIDEDGGDRCQAQYRVLCPNGKVQWFGEAYVKGKCEVASESR